MSASGAPIRGRHWMLVLPALALYVFLMVGPLLQLVYQSVHTQDGGAGRFTIEFYRSLTSPSFVGTLLVTVKTSLASAAICTSIGYLVAYCLVRRCSERVRNIWLNVIVSILFLSLLIRIYALSLTFGSTGVTPWLARVFGFSPTGSGVVEVMIVLGLLNFTLPLAILSLLGVVESVSPALALAAQSLGAPRFKAFLTIDAAICLPRILSTGILIFSLCISAFLVPMILGRGFVQFVSNLVYLRFSDLFDPGTGAAMALVLLAVTLAMIGAAHRLLPNRT
jgi:ABC-type spermidine/putrescine transport system permease subunit I